MSYVNERLFDHESLPEIDCKQIQANHMFKRIPHNVAQSNMNLHDPKIILAVKIGAHHLACTTKLFMEHAI